MDKPLKSVTHDQCDARPTVTFLAAERHRPLDGTKLYCLVTEPQRCEQLAQSRDVHGNGHQWVKITMGPVWIPVGMGTEMLLRKEMGWEWELM